MKTIAKRKYSENKLILNYKTCQKLYIIFNKYQIINKFTNRYKNVKQFPTSLKSMKNFIVLSSEPNLIDKQINQKLNISFQVCV